MNAGYAPLVEPLGETAEPAAVCARFLDLPFLIFLDSAARHTPTGDLEQYSFLTADPVALVRSKGAVTEMRQAASTSWITVPGDALTAARALLPQAPPGPVSGLPPFQGGLAGYIGYDWGAVLERLPRPRYDDLSMPDVMLGFYDWVIAWDHRIGTAWLISTGLPVAGAGREPRARARMDLVRERLGGRRGGRSLGAEVPSGQVGRQTAKEPEAAPAYPVSGIDGASEIGLRSTFTHRDYLDAVGRVREYIVAGDIFQANLSQRFQADPAEAPFDLYRRLRRRNPAPFAAYLDYGELAILSASPERFLRLDQQRRLVETRPIKGTRPRGLGPMHDAALGRALAESEKDRAENVMIVDLLRNDLSRVCRAGTVRVPELFALEHHPTVHHLVSTVIGELESGADAADLIRAAFPGGSITGAPKVRAMEIIAELEPTQRGVYCGSVGYISVTGAMDTSIVIRTYLLLRGRVYFQAGGGIVADSDPELEYRETLDKARGLIETLVESRLATRDFLMILLIDNYDSFVYNLARYVRELGETPLVRRHDAIDVEEILRLGPSHIIISPGPCSPTEAGISTEVVRRLGPQIPILGVCLGHQCIGAAYGGEILRAGHPMHGKISRIHHSGTGLFSGLPSPFIATRYHSLVIAPASVPPSLEVTATADDGEIMAVRHVEHPVYGVQFHPESVLTEHGYRILDHFLHGVPTTPRPLPEGADGVLLPRQLDSSSLATNPPPVDLVR